jgi:hypothetical protein
VAAWETRIEKPELTDRHGGIAPSLSPVKHAAFSTRRIINGEMKFARQYLGVLYHSPFKDDAKRIWLYMRNCLKSWALILIQVYVSAKFRNTRRICTYLCAHVHM